MATSNLNAAAVGRGPHTARLQVFGSRFRAAEHRVGRVRRAGRAASDSESAARTASLSGWAS
jgi:hypothetical protein